MSDSRSPSSVYVDTPPLTVAILSEELKKVTDWRMLGAYLNVPKNVLVRINTEQPSVEHCKMEMFQYWLDTTMTASWKDIASALEQLNMLKLATIVKLKYLRTSPATTTPVVQKDPMDDIYFVPRQTITPHALIQRAEANEEEIVHLHSDTVMPPKSSSSWHIDMSVSRMALRESCQQKDKQLSELKDELLEKSEKLLVYKNKYAQQQKVLERLQQKDIVAQDYEAILAASKEEQQQLQQEVEHWKKMCYARDKQISQLRSEQVPEKYHKQSLAAVDTVDTAVQANYLAVAPDFLRGVEVYGETVLEVVGDKPQKLEWPGYGFYIEIPDGALSQGVTASVAVKVILGGQFTLPDENSQLISAIYWITSSVDFLKEVAVNIQHYAVITSEEQCSKFRFIVAKCSQEVLPYTFREKEGLFNAHTQYGAIKAKRFSMFAETAPKGTDLRITSLKFYKPKPNTCPLLVDFDFVVLYNHEPFLKSVRQQYQSNKYQEDRQKQMLVFEKDEIVLDLPTDDSELKVVDGWKILPLTYPQIDKVDIEQFKCDKDVAGCTIELEWTGNGEPLQLSCQVDIIGAKKPANYFRLRYIPQAVVMDTPSGSTPSVQDVTASPAKHSEQGKQRPTKRDLLVVRMKDGSKLNIMPEIISYGVTASEDLATLLLGDDSVVRRLHLECKDDNDAFVRKVFDTWLSQDDNDSTHSIAPCTWEQLCCCVEDTPGLPGSLVKAIRDQLCS